MWRLVWLFLALLLSSDFNLTNCLQGQKCCWLVVFSFTIALVSWFMLPAFGAYYGKPPPFPWNSEDLSTFNCLGLWKYMKQFPYRKKQTERDILHMPLITCLGYWTDRSCNKNKKLYKKNSIQPVCGLSRALSHNKPISIPWLPWDRSDQLEKERRNPRLFLVA